MSYKVLQCFSAGCAPSCHTPGHAAQSLIYIPQHIFGKLQHGPHCHGNDKFTWGKIYIYISIHHHFVLEDTAWILQKTQSKV